MSFGTGFGAPAPATQPTFSFGSATSTAATPVKPSFTTPSFGFNTAATPSSGLGVFGTPATQSSGFGATPSFGTPAATGFGSASTSTSTFSTPATSFGFGTSTTAFGGAPTTSTGFGTLGAPAPTSSMGFGGFGNFGAAATTSAPSLFGNFGTTTTSSTGFGTSGAFGAFGAKPATTSAGFGAFGTGGGFGGFGASLAQQPQQQQQQQQQQQALQQQQSANAISEALYNAVFNCQLFNDERDNTIARWNLIQALWGTGKAYYSANAQPIELTQENPLCRFKAIGYSCMPNADNNDGLVALCFNKKDQELKDGKQQLINSINTILGNKPNLTVSVDTIKSTGDAKSQATVFVSEKGVTGTSRKIPANELVAYLTQTMQKQQLTQIGVENIFAQVKLEPSQLKEYLDNPPCSIDPRLWKQAQLDNPNPDVYIPVPMIGFQQVKHRLKCQEDETARHRAFLDMAAERIQGLQRQHTATQARLKEHRRSLLELQHRVLQVLVRQEVTRKVGLSLQPEEEILTNRFEAMHAQLSAPTQFKGRISEMLSQLRMRRHVDVQIQERYTMDPIAQDDIKVHERDLRSRREQPQQQQRQQEQPHPSPQQQLQPQPEQQQPLQQQQPHQPPQQKPQQQRPLQAQQQQPVQSQQQQPQQPLQQHQPLQQQQPHQPPQQQLQPQPQQQQPLQQQQPHQPPQQKPQQRRPLQAHEQQPDHQRPLQPQQQQPQQPLQPQQQPLQQQQPEPQPQQQRPLQPRQQQQPHQPPQQQLHPQPQQQQLQPQPQQQQPLQQQQPHQPPQHQRPLQPKQQQLQQQQPLQPQPLQQPPEPQPQPQQPLQPQPLQQLQEEQQPPQQEPHQCQQPPRQATCAENAESGLQTMTSHHDEIFRLQVAFYNESLRSTLMRQELQLERARRTASENEITRRNLLSTQRGIAERLQNLPKQPRPQRRRRRRRYMQ